MFYDFIHLAKGFRMRSKVLSTLNDHECKILYVYNLSQQKRFFVDVTLKPSMAHYRLMTFSYFSTFSSSKLHPNSYLVAQEVFGYCNFLGQKR